MCPGWVQALPEPLANHPVRRWWQTAGDGHFASWFVLLEMNRLGLIVPQGERQGCAGRLDSSRAGHAEGEGRWLSSPQARPMSPFFPLDSGYLFSGSRPPSQVSRSGEVPLSGEENRELRGVTGRPRWVAAACRPGFPEPCVGRNRERLSMSFGVRWAWQFLRFDTVLSSRALRPQPSVSGPCSQQRAVPGLWMETGRPRGHG